MSDAAELTCGKGLAANAGQPEAIAGLLDAMAELFEAHRQALDDGDARSLPEIKAYESLARGHRDAAGALAAIAREMTGYRDLPQAEHDMSAMQRQGAVYERVLERRRRLRELLSPAE